MPLGNIAVLVTTPELQTCTYVDHDAVVPGSVADTRYVPRHGNVTGRASTFELEALPGWDMGSHVHATIEEQFYVIDGEMQLRAGNELIVGGPGAFASVPTGIAHAFANRSDTPARTLLVATPRRLERYFAGLAEILARPGAPDPDEIAALRAHFDATQVSALTV